MKKRVKRIIRKIMKKLKITTKYIYKKRKKLFRIKIKYAKMYNDNVQLSDIVMLRMYNKKRILDILKNIKEKDIIISYRKNSFKRSLKKHIKQKNIRYVKANSKKHMYYLTIAKKIFFDKNIPMYFIKNENQKIYTIVDDKFLYKSNYKIWDKKYISKNILFSDYLVHSNPEKIVKFLEENNFNAIFSGEILDIKLKKYNYSYNKDYQNKKTILFFPSYLKGNGVTETFITLLNEIDYSKYEVYALLNNRLLYKDKQERINKNVHIFYLSGERMYKNKREYNILQSFLKKTKNIDHPILETFCRRNMLALLGTKKFDYCIDYNGYSPFNALLASKGINAKNKIIYMHNDLYSDRNLKNFQLETVFTTYKNFDRIVSVSKSCMKANVNKAAKYIFDKYNFDIKEKMTYIINPVNYQKVLNDSNQNSIIEIDDKNLIKIENLKDNNYYIDAPKKDEFNFITIGRLSPEKNHMMLMDAFKKLLKKQNKAKLYIVGDGVLRKKLEEYVDEIDLKDKIILVGYTTNPFELLKNCDCFVLPSLYEGMGMVVIEAFILNKFVISSDIEGPNEFVTKDYGVLVEPTVDNFYNAMLSFTNMNKKIKAFDYVEHNQKAMKLFYENVLNIREQKNEK